MTFFGFLTRDAMKITEQPLFSIVIPVWNRSSELNRCLMSVADQKFDGYEIIIVDDASETPIQNLPLIGLCPRTMVVTHQTNRGVCAARHTGTLYAKGSWLIFLDSDWTLKLGALKVLQSMTMLVSDRVGCIGGCLETDTGEYWPCVPLPRGEFNFTQFLEWLEKCGDSPSDWLHCVRKDVFYSLSWPQDRRWEAQFCLQVAQQWDQWVTPATLAVEHLSDVRSLSRNQSIEAIRLNVQFAGDQEKMFLEIIEQFGTVMQEYAPKRHCAYMYLAAILGLYSGHRKTTFMMFLKLTRRNPMSKKNYFLLFAGILGPSLVRRFRLSRCYNLVRKLLNS